MKEANVDITTIGYFSWVSLAYSLKFVWAPLADRYSFFGLGRRRSWMIVSQLAIVVGLLFLGTLDPAKSLPVVAAVCVWVAFFSATQDIALDAFRREFLDDSELGLGSSMNQYGYRIGMLVSGGLAIGLAAYTEWMYVYWSMAALMIVGIVTTLYQKEPTAIDFNTRTLRESVVGPFKEFLQRNGAILILFFVFFFKLGDALSGAMLNPFYLEMGYQKLDIGLIAKTFGLASSLVGLFIGSLVIYRIGILKSLWDFRAASSAIDRFLCL